MLKVDSFQYKDANTERERLRETFKLLESLSHILSPSCHSSSSTHCVSSQSIVFVTVSPPPNNHVLLIDLCNQYLSSYNYILSTHIAVSENGNTEQGCFSVFNPCKHCPV